MPPDAILTSITSESCSTQLQLMIFAAWWQCNSSDTWHDSTSHFPCIGVAEHLRTKVANNTTTVSNNVSFSYNESINTKSLSGVKQNWERDLLLHWTYCSWDLLGLISFISHAQRHHDLLQVVNFDFVFNLAQVGCNMLKHQSIICVQIQQAFACKSCFAKLRSWTVNL